MNLHNPTPIPDRKSAIAAVPQRQGWRFPLPGISAPFMAPVLFAVIAGIDGLGTSIAFAALTNGDVDIMAAQTDYVAHDYWTKNMDKLEKISPVSHGLYQAIAVPSYVGINSMEELAAHKDEFGGKIIGIEPGSGLMRDAAAANEAYATGMELVEGSTAAMTDGSLDPLASPAAAAVQRGGRREGLTVLGSFLDSRSSRYMRTISKPGISARHCSRLSAHIAYGTLSVREIDQAAGDGVTDGRDGLPELPRDVDAASTAAYIRSVLEGTRPVPTPIALQVEHILRAVQHHDSPAHAHAL